MEWGYIRTLYTEALPKGELPTQEELQEVRRNPEKANAFLVAYLEHRPEYESYLRYRSGPSYDSALHKKIAVSVREEIQKNPSYEEIKEKMREMAEMINASPDREEIIEKLHSPELIVKDLTRLVFARKVLRLLESA